MNQQIKLKLVDGSGTMWVVPAEIVSTKFRSHRFAVHKSLDLENHLWIVTHEKSSAVVGSGESKVAAIEDAINKLAKVSAQEFDEKVQAALMKKPVVTLGELVRTEIPL